MMPNTIYDYVKAEEVNFEKQRVQVGQNWFWNMREHIQLIFHLKNGIFFTGSNEWRTIARAFKNIMERILNLSYWTEDIAVKDIVFYVDEQDDRALSFLIKKYHDEVYTREHDVDKLLEEITESDLDYGGVLVQKGVERPEVLPLQSIAFCDQTDIKGGPVAFKHNFSPSKLRSMSSHGWGNEKNGATITLDELAILATQTKDAMGTMSRRSNRVPGKNVQVYILRGDMPESYLKDNGDPEKQVYQTQVVAFYVNAKDQEQGVTLYRKEDDPDNLQFFTSREVFGRALGRGVGETLLHPQIWTNFLSIHKLNLLESAAKVVLTTDDPAYSARNKIQDMENLEITTREPGTSIEQIPTAAPNNVALLEKSINEWDLHAQNMGSANDPILGVEQSSGTTFRGQERSVAQGRGIHDRRRGQRAKFIEKIYREMILPDMIKDIRKGKKFLANLSLDELSWLLDQVSTNEANKQLKKDILAGKMRTPEQQTALTTAIKASLMKKGNIHLLEILEGEVDEIEDKIGINIANKQKNLGMLSDKLLSFVQTALANPQGFMEGLKIPGMPSIVNDILEYSGLNQANFSALLTSPLLAGGPTPQAPAQAQSAPAMPALATATPNE